MFNICCTFDRVQCLYSRPYHVSHKEVLRFTIQIQTQIQNQIDSVSHNGWPNNDGSDDHLYDMCSSLYHIIYWKDYVCKTLCVIVHIK